MSLELKNFKVGQVWRRRDGGHETIAVVDAGNSRWPIWAHSGRGYSPAGRWDLWRESSYDLIELTQDVDEPPAQTHLDAQLADAMQASLGATAAELALFDAIVIAASTTPSGGFSKEYISHVLRLRRKLAQSIYE